MTTNIAKIRAALDLYDRLDDSYTGWAEVFEGAYSALAELEKAAAPQFVAGEVSDTMARKLWREWFDASGITGVESAHFWLKALRRELGPALGLVEIREPTPEECTDMAECSQYWSEYDVPLGIHDRIAAALAKAGGQ